MDQQVKDSLKKLTRFFDHPKAGTWERIDLDIRRNRMGWGRLWLQDGRGNALKHRQINLRQTSHDFRFGCNAFKLKDFEEKEKNDAYEAYFKRIFNEAVVPLLWDSTEPEKGMLRYAADSCKMSRRPPADLVVEWCEQNHIAPKGHWLFCDNFVPKWLPRDWNEVMLLLEDRIAGIAERYGRRIRKWDVVNESLCSHPRRDPRIGDASVPPDYLWQIFKMAEKYLPRQSEFLYNDGGNQAFERFAHDSSPMFLLADRLLRRNAKLDGLGIQFHLLADKMEQFSREELCNYFDPAHHLRVLDQLGQLNLPLHISEISLTTFPELPREAAEEFQAQCLRNFYRIWFSHRNCNSIVYWNLCDQTAFGEENRWNACLIDGEFNEKPSYKMLDQLVNREWHTQTTLVTDENGEATWNGFYGEYELEIAGTKKKVSLTPRGENEYKILL